MQRMIRVSRALMTYRVVEVVSLARVTCTFSVAVLHRFSDALLPK